MPDPSPLQNILLKRKLQPEGNPFNNLDPAKMEIVRRMWGDENGLADFNKPGDYYSAGDDMMRVPTPPQFTPGPNIIARPQLASLIHKLFEYAPELTNAARNIQDVPNSALGDEVRPKLREGDAGRLNIMGLHTIDPKMNEDSVYINPRLTSDKAGLYETKQMLPQTLLHEMTHAAGTGDEDLATFAETAYPNFDHFNTYKVLKPAEAVQKIDERKAFFDSILQKMRKP